MSAVTAGVAQPQPVPSEGRHRPTLRLVRSPRRVAPRLPFVAVVLALLSVGLVGLLLLSMQRAQASFRQGSLTSANTTLADQVQALQRTVEHDRDPAVLAARAAALGMVPETDPGYLDARGAVIGPVPAGDPSPVAGAAPVDGVVVAGQAIVPVAPQVSSSPHVAPAAHAKASPRPSPSAKAAPTATRSKRPTPTTSRSAA